MPAEPGTPADLRDGPSGRLGQVTGSDQGSGHRDGSRVRLLTGQVTSSRRRATEVEYRMVV